MGTFWGSSVGYLILMKFFSPVICMNALLYEPLISQILGYAYGIDHFPGYMTIFGVLIVLISIFFVNRGYVIKRGDKQGMVCTS